MLIEWIAIALGIWFVLAPESVRRAGIALHRPLGRTVDPPRALLIRLGGLTWLFVLADPKQFESKTRNAGAGLHGGTYTWKRST